MIFTFDGRRPAVEIFINLTEPDKQPHDFHVCTFEGQGAVEDVNRWRRDRFEWRERNRPRSLFDICIS